jgi:pimeloyl-ACP methyl ester carboxylesterase
MTTFVLIPGAGGVAWYWHRVVRLLEEAQHEAIAVDLPGDDEHAGLSAYADRVLEAIGTRNVVLVAQSLGGFTAPLVTARAPVRMLVLVNAMIPVPGETAGEWWDNTGSIAARVAAVQHGGYSTDFDLATDVPIHVIAGSDDRFFPLDFQRRVAQERLRVTVEQLPGGHLLALSNPRGLADTLLGHLRTGARGSAR